MITKTSVFIHISITRYHNFIILYSQYYDHSSMVDNSESPGNTHLHIFIESMCLLRHFGESKGF